MRPRIQVLDDSLVGQIVDEAMCQACSLSPCSYRRAAFETDGA